MTTDCLVDYLADYLGFAVIICVTESEKARAEERKGQLQAAADSLNHAITLNSRSSSYYYVLSGIYRRLGNLEESKTALDSFTRLDQENSELEKTRRNISKTRGAPHPGGERVQ